MQVDIQIQKTVIRGVHELVEVAMNYGNMGNIRICESWAREMYLSFHVVEN